MKHSLGRLPISLRAIAESQRIKKGVCRPLLIDGCVAVEDDGFVMHVGCEENEVENFRAIWNKSDDGGQSLPPRVRFTIAHEITHTFFYDISEASLRNKMESEHHKTLERVEKECNMAAGAILVPEALLKAEARNSDLLDPKCVLALTEKFRVSVECFVIRMGQSSAWRGTLGAVAYVCERGGEFRIEEIAIHPQLRNLLPGGKRGRRVKDFVHSPSLTLYGGDKQKVLVNIPAKTGETPVWERFELACERATRRTKSYVLTVRWQGQRRTPL